MQMKNKNGMEILTLQKYNINNELKNEQKKLKNIKIMKQELLKNNMRYQEIQNLENYEKKKNDNIKNEIVIKCKM